MDMKQKTGLAIGAGVIGIGAAFGVAWAVTGNNTSAQAQGTSQGQPPGEGRGPGGGGMGMQNMAKALAEKLGVSESEVQEAIQSAMPANPGNGANPGSRPSQGSGSGNLGNMDATLAKAIAEKLGIDEAKVTAALEEVRSEQQANRPDNGNNPNPNPSATG